MNPFKKDYSYLNGNTNISVQQSIALLQSVLSKVNNSCVETIRIYNYEDKGIDLRSTPFGYSSHQMEGFISKKSFKAVFEVKEALRITNDPVFKQRASENREIPKLSASTYEGKYLVSLSIENNLL